MDHGKRRNPADVGRVRIGRDVPWERDDYQVPVVSRPPTIPVHPDLAEAIGQEFISDNGDNVVSAIGQLLLALVDAGLIEWGRVT